MQHHIQQAEKHLAAGKTKQAITKLWDGYYLARAQGDAPALERGQAIAHQLLQRDDGRQRANIEELLTSYERGLATVEAESMTDDERAAERERRAREEARHSVQERYRLLQGTRAERDAHAVACYEYSVVDVPRASVEADLDRAVALGWELISAVAAAPGEHTLYFRRPVLAARDADGRLTSVAAGTGLLPAASAAASAAAGGGFAAFYYESGPDADADGDVDGGLFDSIENLFS